MPTAARLVAALILAILAGIVSLQVMELMPPSTDFGYFLPLNIGLGVLVGWLWLGPNSGDGSGHAISIGLTSAAMLTLIGLFAQSSNEMMRLAMRNRYDGPFEAVAAIFVEGYAYGQLFTIEMLITLAVGGVIAGLVTDWAARRWT